jgi:hypothetical protein
MQTNDKGRFASEFTILILVAESEGPGPLILTPIPGNDPKPVNPPSTASVV